MRPATSETPSQGFILVANAIAKERRAMGSSIYFLPSVDLVLYRVSLPLDLIYYRPSLSVVYFVSKRIHRKPLFPAVQLMWHKELDPTSVVFSRVVLQMPRGLLHWDL